MNRIFHAVMFTVLVTLPVAGFAFEVDLEKCVWLRTGEPLSDKLCNEFRAEAAHDQQVKEQQQRMLAEQQKAFEEAQAKKAEHEAFLDREAEKYRAEMAREEAENERYRAQLAKKQEAEEAGKRKACGKNYMALRVGMSFEQVERCLEALSFVTETVGRGGVIETYRSTFYLIHFSKDKVVAYTRRH